ncbi:hypothetical protein AcW2_000219 [Taiwanofungus camphoratus]|nr:hypothetical protein AcW2_000219 [Antrodia cinnamomea]
MFVLGVVLFRVDLLVLLEILGTLKRFLADHADVRLQWRVHFISKREHPDGTAKANGRRRSPRRWLVMWSLFAHDVPQSFHLQVRQRLPVLLRPMWSLQRWL